MRTERRSVVPARDEQTRQIIHGSVAVDLSTGAITFLIPQKLEGTNAGMWGGHWSKKHKATSQWETFLKIVMADYAKADTVSGFRPHYIRALNLPPVVGRRVITITRFTPSTRNFLKDDDNCAMALKPIVDAIKRLGLIRQDSKDWTRLTPLRQEVSPLGGWWTRALITIPAGEPLPFPGAL